VRDGRWYDTQHRRLLDLITPTAVIGEHLILHQLFTRTTGCGMAAACASSGRPRRLPLCLAPTTVAASLLAFRAAWAINPDGGRKGSPDSAHEWNLSCGPSRSCWCCLRAGWQQPPAGGPLRGACAEPWGGFPFRCTLAPEPDPRPCGQRLAGPVLAGWRVAGELEAWSPALGPQTGPQPRPATPFAAVSSVATEPLHWAFAMGWVCSLRRRCRARGLLPCRWVPLRWRALQSGEPPLRQQRRQLTAWGNLRRFQIP